MSEERKTYDELLREGWALDATKGVQTKRFTSVSFRLVRDGLRVKSVQGYGRTRGAALEDAVAEANAWLRAERIVEYHRALEDPRAARRRSRIPDGSPG